MTDRSKDIAAQVQAAYRERAPLAIRAGGSKAFFGLPEGEALMVSAHRGIIDYQPSELVLTARAGTALHDIEQLLAAQGQMLACEPPHFGDAATLGGTVACGLSGPRRPHCGALRDFVLGARIVNGRGEVLQFGGRVMKNVAGFDASRLMVSARGTLGVLLDVSLKVLPRPESELTLRTRCSEAEAITRCSALAGKSLAVSATAWLSGELSIRLSGSAAALKHARVLIGGDAIAASGAFWRGLREQTLPWFERAPGESLWRLSLPPATPPLALPGRTCLEWGGAQRWLASALPATQVFAAAAQAGGHATLFRSPQPEPPARVQLPAGVAALQARIRQAFDPAGIFNRGLLAHSG
jgi:glycolate oxidase FAD binding subunit